MKKFSFRYQRILEMHIETENDYKNKLGKVNKEIIDIEKKLEQYENKNIAFLLSVEESMKIGITALKLQSIESNKFFLVNSIENIKYEIKMLIQKRIEIQKQLIEANKQRKVMEKLKEKEYNNYLELEAIEESKVIDQIVTYTSSRKSGE